jgi:hypothetical protein
MSRIMYVRMWGAPKIVYATLAATFSDNTAIHVTSTIIWENNTLHAVPYIWIVKVKVTLRPTISLSVRHGKHYEAKT